MSEEDRILVDKMIHYRARENISAKELGRRCKLSTQTIYSVENGIQSPSRLTRQKILNVINK